MNKRIKNKSIINLLMICSLFALQIPTVAAFAFTSTTFAKGTTKSSRTKTEEAKFQLAASTFDSPPSEMSDFQRRMRKLAIPGKKPRRQKNLPKNFRVVTNLEDYKRIIGGNKDKLIIVRFYAPWCKACKAIAPSFYRLAGTYKQALFLDVPVKPENANLHQGLGVTSLPFGHIYHPTGGLVEELKISKKYFPKFARVLKSYVEGLCDIEEYDSIKKTNDINKNP